MTVVCELPADRQRGDPGEGAGWEALADACVDRFGGVATPGAAGMGGVVAAFDTPTDAIDAGLWLVRDRPGCAPVGVGVHTGEIELASHGLTGPAVPVAVEVAQSASPGDVRASASVRNLCAGTGFAFHDCDAVTIAGFGDLDLYRVRRRQAVVAG